MAKIKKRGNKLSVRYTIDGKEKTKATGLDDTPSNREFIKLQVIPKLLEKIEAIELDPKDKISDLATYYLKEKEDLKTFEEIKTRVEKHILPKFGNKRIEEISLEQLKAWMEQFSVSPKTVRHYVGDFRRIYQIAKEHQKIKDNLFDLVHLKKHIKKEIYPFSKEEVKKVLSTAKGQMLNFFGIAFYSGARAGEIIGLKVEDIDFETCTIDIKRSISKGYISTPKTAGSIRQVPMLESVIPYLKEQVALANEKKSEWLFCNREGDYYRASSSLNLLRFLKENNFNHRVHDTRHTFITNMLNSGKIKLTDLARIVGHSNPQMILTVYAKWIKSEHIKIALDGDLYSDEKTYQ